MAGLGLLVFLIFAGLGALWGDFGMARLFIWALGYAFHVLASLTAFVPSWIMRWEFGRVRSRVTIFYIILAEVLAMK